MTMKILFILLALMLTIPAMAVADASTEAESWRRFRAEMNGLYEGHYTLRRTITKKQTRIEFCPDNTCSEFKAPRSASFDVLADFIYLFTFHAPSYEQEREWIPKKEVAEYAQGLLSKYRAQAKCEAASEAKVAHCVLRHLVKTQQIMLNIVRYDEGQRVASPARIDEFFQEGESNGLGSQ